MFAGSDNVMFPFFALTDKGILPSVATREIPLDQLKSVPDCTYHLLVNSLATVVGLVEFGRITRSLSPYISRRYQTIIELYIVKFPPTKIFPPLSTARL